LLAEIEIWIWEVGGKMKGKSRKSLANLLNLLKLSDAESNFSSFSGTFLKF
jgi:hypothetical protein